MGQERQSTDEALLRRLEDLAIEAGRQIMRYRTTGFDVSIKSDSSPVTAADREAEAIILAGLGETCPDVPVVAEEAVSAGRCPQALGDVFFLVDPLDGTKEFVNGRDDFTVNIALIREGTPVLGVVYAPAKLSLCSGRPGHAETVALSPDHVTISRHTVAVRTPGAVPHIVASRSHRTLETDTFIARFPGAGTVSVGSSLKFCLLACGEADIYPRFGRTMEWDTAAGDAVLRAAGGMTFMIDGRPFAYGKRSQPNDTDFANPHFIAVGKVKPEWAGLVGPGAAMAG